MTNKKHTSPLAAVQELAILTGAVAIIAAAGAVLLAGALSAAGVRYEMHLYPRGVHGLSLATPEVDEPAKHRLADPHIAGWFGQCLEWLDTLRTIKE